MTRDAFVAQVERYKDQFYRFVLRTVWDREKADDVFQSGLLAALENLGQFSSGTNFRAWIFRILLNKCFVANRDTRRTPLSIEGALNELLEVGNNPGYAEILQEPERFLAECSDEVVGAMRRLSTAERACLMFRVVEELSYREIAEIMEVPMGTVMTHLARGRAKLRQELASFAAESGFLRGRR